MEAERHKGYLSVVVEGKDLEEFTYKNSEFFWRELLNQKRSLVIDFSETRYVCCRVVGALLETKRIADKNGLFIAIVPSSILSRLIAIMPKDIKEKMPNIYNSRNEAMASYNRLLS